MSATVAWSAGAFADDVIFDLAAVRDRATYEHPHRFPEGMRYVLNHGLPALSDGNLTESRHGRMPTRQTTLRLACPSHRKRNGNRL